MKLCSEAERYVNKDYIPFSELYLDIDVDTIALEYEDSVWNLVDLENSNRLKTAIRGLSKDGKNTYEIAYYVPCSRRYIREVIGSNCTINAQ